MACPFSPCGFASCFSSGTRLNPPSPGASAAGSSWRRSARWRVRPCCCGRWRHAASPSGSSIRKAKSSRSRSSPSCSSVRRCQPWRSPPSSARPSESSCSQPRPHGPHRSETKLGGSSCLLRARFRVRLRDLRRRLPRRQSRARSRLSFPSPPRKRCSGASSCRRSCSVAGCWPAIPPYVLGALRQWRVSMFAGVAGALASLANVTALALAPGVAGAHADPDRGRVQLLRLAPRLPRSDEPAGTRRHRAHHGGAVILILWTTR